MREGAEGSKGKMERSRKRRERRKSRSEALNRRKTTARFPAPTQKLHIRDRGPLQL